MRLHSLTWVAYKKSVHRNLQSFDAPCSHKLSRYSIMSLYHSIRMFGYVNSIVLGSWVSNFWFSLLSRSRVCVFTNTIDHFLRLRGIRRDVSSDNVATRQLERYQMVAVSQPYCSGSFGSGMWYLFEWRHFYKYIRTCYYAIILRIASWYLYYLLLSTIHRSITPPLRRPLPPPLSSLCPPDSQPAQTSRRTSSASPRISPCATENSSCILSHSDTDVFSPKIARICCTMRSAVPRKGHRISTRGRQNPWSRAFRYSSIWLFQVQFIYQFNVFVLYLQHAVCKRT